MDRKINVLLVTGSLSIGGMETVAMNIVRYSNKNLFKFDFLVYGDKKYANEEEAIRLGCHIYRIPFPHETPLTFEKNVRRIIREHGPYQIVHCHNLFNCGYVAKAASKEGVLVRISHSHTNRISKSRSIIRNIYEWYMRKLMLKYSTDFFACSEKAGIYLFNSIFKTKGYILKNGIDIDKFKVNNKIRENYRSIYNLRDKYVIGQVGTLCDVKNHKFSLTVFKRLIKDKPNIFKLVFVGDGELRTSIEKDINELELSNDVLLLGRRNDIPELLNMFDLYFMPSKYEGVSVALMEAQAAGLPCLTSDTACAPEVKVTSQINTLNLNESVDIWASEMKRMAFSGRYGDSSTQIKNKGYSIQDIIASLNLKYLEAYNRGGKL